MSEKQTEDLKKETVDANEKVEMDTEHREEQVETETKETGEKQETEKNEAEKPEKVEEKTAEQTEKPVTGEEETTEQTEKPEKVEKETTEQTEKPATVEEETTEQTEKTGTVKEETTEQTEKPEKVEEEQAEKTETLEEPDAPYVLKDIKKQRKKLPVFAKVFIIAAAVFAILYFGGVVFFATHFGFHSTINGVDVSFMSVNQAQDTIDAVFRNYEITILERGGQTESIHAEDIGLQYEMIGTIDDVIKQQNCWLWFVDGIEPKEYFIEVNVTYAKSLLHQAIDELNCMQKNQTVYPEEPQIVKKSGEYMVEDGVEGNQLQVFAVRKVITNAINQMEANIDLEKENCYVTLNYSKDDEIVQTAVDYMNALQDMKITYRLDEEEEVLDGSQIAEWAEISKDYEITFDEAAMAEYIEYLKETYEIKGQTVSFDTTYGSEVQIKSYIQSSAIDTEAEVENLSNKIAEAYESGRTEFVRTSEDMAAINDTYIEINLTSQQLYCYKDGEMILHTDIVSGKPSTGCATPPGVYTIRSKSSPAILVGETYRTPVSYWMPFNGGIGLHDATWQGSFGGRRYITNGSHGCINLRLDIAKFIYENYSAGDPVVLYHLDGTETSETTPAGKASSSPIPVYTEATTETATEVITEAPTEASTEIPTEATTEITTEVTTEATTEDVTETSTGDNIEQPGS